MKTLLVFFVVFLLILASLRADARRLTLEEKTKLKAERKFLSKTNTDQEGDDDTKVEASNMGTEEAGDGDDEKNGIHNEYERPSGNNTEDHRYWCSVNPVYKPCPSKVYGGA